MPLVDGYSSTQMIRQEEQKPATKLSSVAKDLGRTPIFAVSASLKPEDLGKFVEIGFDGWLLKPVDFRRLNLLLSGAFSAYSRKEGSYDRSRFKMGGWFAASLDTK
jgi:CheY-like chemotaxis protein